MTYRDNKDFYRDYAEYMFITSALVPVGFAIQNVGSNLARNAQLETKFSKIPNVIFMDEAELPESPVKGHDFLAETTRPRSLIHPLAEQLSPAPGTEKERKGLEKLLKVIVDWDQVKDGNSEAILKARRLIQESYPDGPPKLLDPFMGGCVLGLEALR